MSGRPRMVALLISLTLGGGLLAAGCGGDDSGSTTSAEATSTSAAASTDAIDIADFKYDPDSVNVDAGTEITWTNSDDAAHTATADDSSFDTGDLDPGDSASVTFDEAGTFTYYCRFHPFMKATVEVQ